MVTVGVTFRKDQILPKLKSLPEEVEGNPLSVLKSGMVHGVVDNFQQSNGTCLKSR
jgi:hypothetical protein